MSWSDPCSYCGEHRADCDCGNWGKQKPKDNMNHVMIDLETLGTDHNSVFLSIAAVRFDLDTGETHPNTYYKNIKLHSALSHGLEVDAKTIQWWLTQNHDIMLKMFDHPSDLVYVLNDFDLWMGKDKIVWGNSARFDLGILANAYKKIGMPHPWDFRNERCYRTLISMFPYIEIDKPKNAHDPLIDCKYQIAKLFMTWNVIKPKDKVTSTHEWEQPKK